MSWTKKGLIFNVNAKHSWNKTHAQCPVVDLIDDHLWRIYYASRNAKGQSQISYIEVEAGNPSHILYEHPDYLFDFGALGTFDESGLMPSAIVTYGHKKYMYYIGWSVKKEVPYHNAIGLAYSMDNGKTFRRLYEGPILSSTHLEPYFTGTSCVMKEGDLWRMWYLSCTKWDLIHGIQEPFYHLKYAESKNGITWDRQGIVAIDFKTPTEGGIASASVLKEDGIYKMWYAYRDAHGYRAHKNKSYRIGYAESQDGIKWKRLDDQVGIALSETGWDSFMMTYPNVIKYKDTKYLFYNGDGFGQSGFGYAIQ
ncbi:hypothetical protein ACS386_11095 [Flavobacteriaceae bacterium LMO-SS05]